jgi:leader peptidase (prepilin peptidase)/N-methyltransferase
VVLIVDHRQPFTGIVEGALVAGLPLLVVHLVYPGGLGFGDVRYGFVLGGSLGIIDWSLAAWVLLCAALTSLVGMVVVRSWRRSAPFGPFLAGSGLAVLLASRALL